MCVCLLALFFLFCPQPPCIINKQDVICIQFPYGLCDNRELSLTCKCFTHSTSDFAKITFTFVIFQTRKKSVFHISMFNMDNIKIH